MIHLINHTRWTFSPSLHLELFSMIKYLEKKYACQTGEINYCFLNKKVIKQLNREFLNKDGPTDILTFPNLDEKKITGDIAICLEIVREDAKKDKKHFAKYLAEVLLHGSLHLFGLEHDYTPTSLNNVYRLHDKILNELKLDWRAFDVK